MNGMKKFYLALVGVAFGLALWVQQGASAYPPGREPMRLPQNYRSALVHYATVDRGDGFSRYLYISPQALAALQSGAGFPERTLVLIEAFAAAPDATGKPQRDPHGRWLPGEPQAEIHAAEMRTTWHLADMRTSSRAGDWNFGAFLATDGTPVTEHLNDCFSCHEGAARQDFLFSRALLSAYIQTGEVQYRFCAAPDRAICRF